MRWANVWTIFRREVRDQARDRRTLFMVFILPILLYPILGIGVLQFYLAFEEKPRIVVLIGAEHLPASPALLNPSGDAFAPGLAEGAAVGGGMRIRTERAGGVWDDAKARRVMIRDGQADAVVVIPPDVTEQLEREKSANFPIDYVSADERSQITYLRVREILSRWNEQIVQGRLLKAHKTSDYVEPVRTSGTDLATKAEAGGNVWAKLFPFLLVIMALTGAFYPSVDLCAGEKERGTMETLLVSPASRAEIVFGKFFTVVLASMLTATLNLLSMALTGLQLAYQLGGGTGEAARGLGPPTGIAFFWMGVVLIPLAVFFAAVCLSLAVLARSMKEGQYYMTPLYMVSLPLILLTLAPGVELTPFYAMVPITGVSLLLRSLILSEYGVARRYFIPVLVPMLLYGAVALRWAVDQFHREDILFRESERLDLVGWARHLIKHREPTPSGGQALLCFTLMICLAWFAMQAVGQWLPPLAAIATLHLLCILGPPLLMALVLTSDPARTLRFARPEGRYVAIAIGLGLSLNPLVRELSSLVNVLFPTPAAVAERAKELTDAIPNVAVGILLLALIPSITEEIAFRGFILSGLGRGYRNRSAILISAFLFGFLHVLISLFNQFFVSTLLGVLLGLLAIRSRSLLPGICFHFTNNALAFLSAGAFGSLAPRIFRDAAKGLYQWPVVATGLILAAWLLQRLYRDVRPPTPTSTPVDPEFGTRLDPTAGSAEVARAG